MFSLCNQITIQIFYHGLQNSAWCLLPASLSTFSLSTHHLIHNASSVALFLFQVFCIDIHSA